MVDIDLAFRDIKLVDINLLTPYNYVSKFFSNLHDLLLYFKCGIKFVYKQHNVKIVETDSNYQLIKNMYKGKVIHNIFSRCLLNKNENNRNIISNSVYVSSLSWYNDYKLDVDTSNFDYLCDQFKQYDNLLPDVKLTKYGLSCKVDALDSNSIYELKVKSDISLLDMLQAIIYCYIYDKSNINFLLINDDLRICKYSVKVTKNMLSVAKKCIMIYTNYNRDHRSSEFIVKLLDTRYSKCSSCGYIDYCTERSKTYEYSNC